MAKIPKRPPIQNDEFIHQYGSSVHQYGASNGATLSDQNAQEFQEHLKAQEIQQPNKISPHQMMSKPPASTEITPNQLVHPMDKPAPENFGPPKITPSDSDMHADFGPPGSKGFTQVKSSLGAPKGQVVQKNPSNDPNGPNSVDQRVQSAQKQLLSQTQKSSDPSKPDLGSSNNSLSAEKKKKATYKSVEKMEVNNMLQNAMNHMKLKDPDPQAWN